MKNQTIITRTQRQQLKSHGWEVNPETNKETDGKGRHLQTGKCTAINAAGDIELRVSNKVVADFLITPFTLDSIAFSKVEKLIDTMQNDINSLVESDVHYMAKYANTEQLARIAVIVENMD